MARLSLSKTSTDCPLVMVPRTGTATVAQLVASELCPGRDGPRAEEPSSTPRRTSIEKKEWDAAGRGQLARAGTRTFRLAAGHAHVAGERGPLVAPVDDEVMPLGLA